MTDTQRELFEKIAKEKFGWLNPLEVLDSKKYGDADYERVFWAYEGYQAALAHSQQEYEFIGEVVMCNEPEWMKPHETVKWHKSDFPLGTKFYAQPPITNRKDE